MTQWHCDNLKETSAWCSKTRGAVKTSDSRKSLNLTEQMLVLVLYQFLFSFLFKIIICHEFLICKVVLFVSFKNLINHIMSFFTL